MSRDLLNKMKNIKTIFDKVGANLFARVSLRLFLSVILSEMLRFTQHDILSVILSFPSVILRSRTFCHCAHEQSVVGNNLVSENVRDKLRRRISLMRYFATAQYDKRIRTVPILLLGYGVSFLFFVERPFVVRPFKVAKSEDKSSLYFSEMNNAGN